MISSSERMRSLESPTSATAPPTGSQQRSSAFKNNSLKGASSIVMIKRLKGGKGGGDEEETRKTFCGIRIWSKKKKTKKNGSGSGGMVQPPNDADEDVRCRDGEAVNREDKVEEWLRDSPSNASPGADGASIAPSFGNSARPSVAGSSFSGGVSFGNGARASVVSGTSLNLSVSVAEVHERERDRLLEGITEEDMDAKHVPNLDDGDSDDSNEELPVRMLVKNKGEKEKGDTAEASPLELEHSSPENEQRPRMELLMERRASKPNKKGHHVSIDPEFVHEDERRASCKPQQLLPQSGGAPASPTLAATIVQRQLRLYSSQSGSNAVSSPVTDSVVVSH